MGAVENPLQRIFLAGVGAVSVGAEKSQQFVDELVERGQVAVDQGKGLVSELSLRGEADAAKVRSEMIRSCMRGMTKEQRDAFVADVAEMATSMDDGGGDVL